MSFKPRQASTTDAAIAVDQPPASQAVVQFQDEEGKEGDHHHHSYYEGDHHHQDLAEVYDAEGNALSSLLEEDDDQGQMRRPVPPVGPVTPMFVPLIMKQQDAEEKAFRKMKKLIREGAFSPQNLSGRGRTGASALSHHGETQSARLFHSIGGGDVDQSIWDTRGAATGRDRYGRRIIKKGTTLRRQKKEEDDWYLTVPVSIASTILGLRGQPPIVVSAGQLQPSGHLPLLSESDVPLGKVSAATIKRRKKAADALQKAQELEQQQRTATGGLPLHPPPPPQPSNLDRASRGNTTTTTTTMYGSISSGSSVTHPLGLGLPRVSAPTEHTPLTPTAPPTSTMPSGAAVMMSQPALDTVESSSFYNHQQQQHHYHHNVLQAQLQQQQQQHPNNRSGRSTTPLDTMLLPRVSSGNKRFHSRFMQEHRRDLHVIATDF